MVSIFNVGVDNNVVLDGVFHRLPFDDTTLYYHWDRNYFRNPKVYKKVI
jgi:hypothetical protein